MTSVQKTIRHMVGRQLDVFLSSNRVFTEAFPEAMEVEPSHFYNTGLPRNDLFFGDYSYCREKVCRYFKIPEEKKLLLFAPTFRGSFYQAEDVDNLDYSRVVRALEQRFGGSFAVLERKHHAVKLKITEGVYHASDYPDMQELHNSLAKIIQPEFVPELIKVTDCAEYMFAGGLMEAARYEKEGLHK